MDARTFAKKKIAEAIHHFHFFFNLTRHLFSAITITQREKWRLSPKKPKAAAGCRTTAHRGPEKSKRFRNLQVKKDEQ